MKRSHSIIYTSIVGCIFATFVIVFNFFPRSTVSELENRELAKFPQFSWDSIASGKYMTEISSWYSDSEPYRDLFMALSMDVDKAKKLNISSASGEDDVTFIAGDSDSSPESEGVDEDPDTAATIMARDDKAKIANHGIVVVGSAPNVRALMAYKGSPNACIGYAKVANELKEALGESVNVYCLIIPTAVEFYCPAKAKGRMTSQRATIENAHKLLNSNVKAVDAYVPLSHHIDEDIYLRTDHHWSPLGGYYAAREIAKVAGVPFKDLESYDRHIIKGYVGSMHRYSKDVSVKKSPEDFVYYTPRDIEYTTTYINYGIDKSYNVTSVKQPTQGNYFVKYPDGSGGAYCTFMGGDSKITQVRTGAANGRRIAIMKDSFGNTIPGYLFYSFEEVHVIDFRYFHRNLKDYVSENKITDLVIANNIMAAAGVAPSAYRKFLTQPDGVIASKPTVSEKSEKKEKKPEKKQDSKKNK